MRTLLVLLFGTFSVLLFAVVPAAASGGFSGNVTDADSNAPLPCEIGLLSESGEWLESAFCDVNGLYEIGGLEAGQYMAVAAVVDRPEYYQVFFDDAVSSDAATLIPVVDGAVTADIDFAMRVGGTVSGTVLANIDGEPIEGIGVQVYNVPDWTLTITTASADSGAFTVVGIPPGTFNVQAFDENEIYLTQYWDHDATGGETTDLVFTGAEDFQNVDFDMVAAAHIVGQVVVEADAAPVAGAFVEAHDWQWERRGIDTSGSDGSFDVGGLIPDSYVIYAEAEGYTSSYFNDEDGDPLSITLGESEIYSDVVITLPQGGAISGQLMRAPDSSAVVNGHVWAWRPVDFVGNTDHSDENGLFRVDGLPPGVYNLWCEGPVGENLVPRVYSDDSGEAVDLAVTIDEEITGIVVSLELGGIIEGRVISADDGEPIPNTEVKAVEVEGWSDRETVTDEDGAYSINGLGDREYLVSANHPDFLHQVYDGAVYQNNGTPVRVGPGETMGDIDFELGGAGKISGTVASALTGDGVENVYVEAFLDRDTWIPGAVAETDSDGNYSIGSVAAGEQVFVLAYDWQGRFAWQWYESASVFDEAAPLTVVEGAVTPAVDFLLLSPGVVSVSATELSFAGVTYQDDIPPQSIVVSNIGTGPATVYLWSESDWLCLDYDWFDTTLEAGEDLQVEVSAWVWGLDAGVYADSIHIYNELTGEELLVAVDVTLAESPPILDLNPVELWFDAEVGGPDPDSQAFFPANIGGGTVSFTVDSFPAWLDVSPVSGTLRRGRDATVVMVAPSFDDLEAGEYHGTVDLGTTAGPAQVHVYLDVAPVPEADPQIVVPENVVILVPGGLKRAEAKQHAQTTFDIANDGEGTLCWNAREEESWITVEPSRGTIAAGAEPVSVTVTADPSVLSAGMNSTFIEIGASRDRAEVEVGVQIGSEPDESAQVESTPRGHLMVPVLAHVQGANGSFFASDLWISHVPSGHDAEVTLFFVPEGADGTVEAVSTDLAISSGKTVSLLDVMANWLGGIIPKGAIVIQGDEVDEFETTSRTYNKSANGTFGQEVPGVSSLDGVGRLQGRLYIPGLEQSADPDAGFRSNVLVTEVSGHEATVLIELYDHGGSLLGSTTFEVQPFSTTQVNRVFQAVGFAGAARGARAEVEVQDGDGRVVAIGSTVDNITNDPTTLFGVKKSSTVATSFIPVVAKAAGLNDTQWVSDVMISNVDTTARQLAISYHSRVGEVVATVHPTLEPGHTLVYDDIVGATFAREGSRGSIRIDGEPLGGLAVTSRTYNQGEAGTYGQGLSAIDQAEALTVGGGTVRLIALNNSARFRTNLGITEILGRQVTVGVTLYDQSGEEVLGYRRVTIPGFGQFQENVLEAMGLGGTSIFAATAVIQVSEGTGGITVYASTVDNATGDATTLLPPVRVEVGGPTDTQGDGGAGPQP